MNPPRFSGLLFSALLLALPACGVSIIGGGSAGESTTSGGTGTTTTGGSSCGGVCNGVTLSSAPITTVGDLAGTWELCAGQLYWQSGNDGGFPPDTTGMEILANGTVYLHVAGDAGSFPRGVGPQYEWNATLNTPISSTNPSVTTLNLSSSYSNGLLGYDVTLMPAADGCSAALHLEGASSGLPSESADMIAH